MSATDEIRRLLDERGVEWWELQPDLTECIVNDVRIKFRRVGRGIITSTCREGVISPEQAIAETIGRGTCDLIARTRKDGRRKSGVQFDGIVCSNCGQSHSGEYIETVSGRAVVLREPGANYCHSCGCKLGNDVSRYMKQILQEEGLYVDGE